MADWLNVFYCPQIKKDKSTFAYYFSWEKQILEDKNPYINGLELKKKVLVNDLKFVKKFIKG